MAEEIVYVVLTPYTIRKSRTGAVLGRLLGRTSAELVATQMYALPSGFAARVAETIGPGRSAQREGHRQLIREYVVRNFTPASDGRLHRILLLVFKGENAYQDIHDIVGSWRISSEQGETIRDTYGDLVETDAGEVVYLEPAVIMADSAKSAVDDLRMWVEFATKVPAVLSGLLKYANPERVEQTLVIIKPDNWKYRSSKPGAIVDMFSRTGLRIIGMKVVHMSVAQALRFYGPVKDALVRKLAPGVGTRARTILERELGLELSESLDSMLTAEIGVPYAQKTFEGIIEFMAGMRPDACPPSERQNKGKVKCLALIYEGEDAVSRIRDVLGPTDPSQAQGGTVRGEFGRDVMVNTAHASDSAQNAEREAAILKMHEGNVLTIVPALLEQSSQEDPE
ncbi:MAG: nucleoside-diphosphate kinase [Lentisphaeria bacterium]|nr:nucleoside-diphosphate kinase [Lentisphaeria bacterium]